LSLHFRFENSPILTSFKIGPLHKHLSTQKMTFV